MIMPVDINGVNDSNRFLRVLWAEIRKEFQFGWHYYPFRDGKTNTIHFGDMGLSGVNSPVHVSITYSTKGSIRQINFRFDKEEIDPESELGKKLMIAVERAKEPSYKGNYWSFNTVIESGVGPISAYEGERFSITPIGGRYFRLNISVYAYDEVDAKHEYRKLLFNIMNVLSIETNSAYWISTKKRKFKKLQKVETNTYMGELDWIDDYPVKGKYVIITEKCKNFIDYIIKEVVYPESINIYLRACKLFHTARKHEHSLFNKEVNYYHYGDSTLDVIPVLYMTTMEVISTIDIGKYETCSECGQAMYKITDRVSTLAAELFEAEHMKKLFKQFYSSRSKSLHMGISLTTQTYAGTSIPQLDLDDPSGCQLQSTYSSLNMREYVSYCMRKVLQERLNF
jgi:hypothetical protein